MNPPRKIFTLVLILLVLGLQIFWLLTWHNPFPPDGQIHGTSYRDSERQAALDEWARHPNPTTEAKRDEEERRAEKHEWIVCIAWLVLFTILDGSIYYFCYHRRRPATKLEKAAAARIGRKISFAVVALYVGVYILLSLSGGYILTQSGQVRYNFGFSVSDLQQWQPRFTFCQRFRQVDGSWTLRANFLGYVFTPLALLDQTFVHRTVRLFDPETGEPIDK
jgi:peptidoglycan/LPS O-acetylase OafA/YrhL